MKGRVYLLVEKTDRGRSLRVTSHRMTKPTQGAAEGIWVGLDLEIPESVFGPYEATLALPENDLAGTVTVTRPDHVGEMIGEEEE